MKIALKCHSILIEKSLHRFLKNRLVPEQEADIVVSDHDTVTEKPLLRIGSDPEADLKKPFSRSQLMIKLEEKLKSSTNRQRVHSFSLEEEDETLEEKIERVTRLFVDDLVAIIKEHYETKK
ncbi:hypothetical protein [Hydrogenimonas urashimensis]|uniref:hypothetical protein n=1 Tax=Hydrogenimonas urashimensis TaxID=2740515 RepID=UPI0019164EB7|nr:hypothetical protein [Hydrogenimonas urashimensis]